MKIVAIMCVEEHSGMARKLLRELKVPAFSESEIMGHKLGSDDAGENWFADKQSMDNSHLFFTMCDEDMADRILQSVEKCKQQINQNHVHAFVLNVEKYIK